MAYYVLHKFHILPGDFMALSDEERAFVYAAINVRLEEEKRQAAKMKKK
ncbi:hypothetical protein [Aminipila butyrica]|nr:hypothetical protein [Aminipila butyrica]